MPQVSQTRWCFAEKYRRYLKREMLRQKLLKKEDSDLKSNFSKIGQLAHKMREGVQKCLRESNDQNSPSYDTNPEHAESTFFLSQRKSTIEKLPDIDHSKYKSGAQTQREISKEKLRWLCPLTQSASDKSGNQKLKQAGTKSAKLTPYQKIYETEYRKIEEDFEPLPVFNQMVITKPRYLFTHRVKQDRPRMPALATLNQDQLSAEVRGIKQFGFNMVAAAAKHKQRLQMARLKSRREKEQMNGERLMRGCLTERVMGYGSIGGGLSSLGSESQLWRGE